MHIYGKSVSSQDKWHRKWKKRRKRREKEVRMKKKMTWTAKKMKVNFCRKKNFFWGTELNDNDNRFLIRLNSSQNKLCIQHVLPSHNQIMMMWWKEKDLNPSFPTFSAVYQIERVYKLSVKHKNMVSENILPLHL